VPCLQEQEHAGQKDCDHRLRHTRSACYCRPASRHYQCLPVGNHGDVASGYAARTQPLFATIHHVRR
jgi:hypothetical protein